MEAITLPIYSTEGKEVETVTLNPNVFDGQIHFAAIYQAVNAYLANQRQGLAATKTRGEVSGGGKKPWKQKGTGRARVGSTRSPLWRHGGVVFGPHPRDFSYTIPEKIKALALKSALNAKVKENNMMVVDGFLLDAPKTKDALKVMASLKVIPAKKKQGQVLLLLSKCDKNTQLALRNIPFLHTAEARNTHAYEVMKHKKILITKDGLQDLVHRLK